MFNFILSFILVLYAEPGLARNIVSNIIHFFYYFLKTMFLRNLENDVLYIIDSSADKQEEIVRIKSLFKDYSNVYNPFLHEINRMNSLKFKHRYQDPVEFEIQSKWSEKVIDDESIFIQEPIKAVKIPLDYSLKMFLENSNTLEKTLEYKKSLSNKKVISNITQGLWWKSLPNLTDTTLPLYIFCDDIETGNALGSRAGVNKFTAFYAKIACLPPEISSRLDSILFSRIMRVNDKKKICKKTVFDDLVTELKNLQKDGISVDTPNGPVNVKFQLALVLGDNLGLNELCGFVDSFNSNVYCRICTATSNECSNLCYEDKKKMRNVRNYEDHLKANDEKTTGIKSECIFNCIPKFHIAVNRTLDFMHDFWEGVCKYILQFILNHYIYEKEYFTVEALNQRCKNHSYNRKDSNKIPPIKKHPKKKKISLKMSASEMSCFVRYFGVIIGDIMRDKDDEYWRLYVLLRKIADILQSPRYTLSDLENLRIFVHNLLSLYLELGGKLKPKFHFLTHYATIMEYFGPCIHFDSSRYESRHTVVKANFIATASRRNPMKTISIKQMMYLCNACTNSRFYEECPLERKDKEQKKPFAVGDFIVTNLKNHEIEFGEIVEIKDDLESENESDKIFVLQLYYETAFDDFYYSYIVEKDDKIIEIKESELCFPSNTLNSVKKNDVHIITAKYLI